MKTRRMRIGNSRGELRGDTIVITAQKAPRSGWAEAARKLHAEGGDHLLDAPTLTRFDESEWQW